MTMSNDDMVKSLSTAIAETTKVRDALAGGGPTPGGPILVPAGSDLQKAITDAPAGAVLALESGTWLVNQIKTPKAITLTTRNQVPPGRATSTTPVTILGNSDVTIQIDGNEVRFVGIGMGNQNADGELANVVGSDVTFDRVVGMGDPAKGLHRGIRLHGVKTRVVKSYFDHIFAFGRDSVVLGGWDGGNDILIDDCYLCGGAETIMFGGADSTSPDRIPKQIAITNSRLTKRSEWYGMGVQIKNAFELKSALNVYMGDCVLEYAGVAQGQSAYLFVMTPRNQNGRAPWSTVKHVLIERCTAQYGGGCVNFLGTDNNQTSDPMDDVTFRNVHFLGIDPLGITKGAGRGFVFDRAPAGVTLDGITVEAQNLGSLGYFANSPNQPTRLTMKNWKYPVTRYGWKIDAGGQDAPPASKNIQALMPDLVYAITANDAGAVGTPTP